MKFVVCSVCKGCLSPSQVPQLPCSKWVGEPDYLSPCQLCIHTLNTMYTIQCIVYMCIVYMCIHIVCAQGLSVLLPRCPSRAHSCTTLFCCYTLARLHLRILKILARRVYCLLVRPAAHCFLGLVAPHPDGVTVG